LPPPHPLEKAPTGAARVLTTLRVLGEHPDGVGLVELSRILRSPKSSVHRALGLLRHADFVDQSDEGRYQLSFGFLQLAFSYYDQLDQVARIRPTLTELADRFGETAHYAVLHGAEVTYLGKAQAETGQVQMSSRVGGRNPAHSTGVGKALLAYQLDDRRRVDEYVAVHGPLERRTPRTLVDARPLHADLVATRRHGFAIDGEENETGINCLAVPLFLTSREVPDGAISISALAQRYPVGKLRAIASDVRAIVEGRLGQVVPGQDKGGDSG
jgi:IclR family transcriptional regulator, acetate operon repressor